MAEFAQRRHKKAISSNNNNRSNGFASKNMYEDVFGGAPKFSSRVEDYSEIFSSYNNSSRASSIPFLDLPPVNDDEVHSSNFDYLEIFGGYDSVDYGVSYQELFVDDCRTTAGDSSSSSSQDVWTPAETGSPSEESSENPVSLECNQAFSTIESYDGVKQFNVSYHKTNQISTEDGISGTTHIAQLNAIPAYTFVVDQNPPVQKDKSDNSQPEVANDSSANANIADLRMDGEHYWEKPSQPATASDQKPQKNLDGNGNYVEKPFVTVSEISLRTQPSEVPPPTRPPPKFAIKHESHKFMAPDLGSSAKYARQKTASRIPPPFFDVEVDSSSSAAASAAAMKDAMEKAQATLKSAKEMMERRMDGLQRKKMGLKESSKVKDRKEGGIAHDVINGKEDGMKNFEREERQKGVGLVQVASQFEVKSKLFNVSKESADDKHSKQCRLTQEFQHVGEWKAEEQYYELVKKDPVETLFVAPELKRSERLVPGAYQNEQKEKKAEKLLFVQQEKSNGKFEEAKRVLCGLEEDKNRFNVGKVGGERVEHENMKTDEIVCEQEEYDKRQKEAQNLREAERKLKKTGEQEKKTALEQEEQEKLKESREREENEKRRKEAFIRDENERKQKEAREKEEYESRLRESQERKENEKRLKEAREREETERRLREAREREETERRLKEAREREETERRLKEAHEREETERLLKEALEREENERLLKEALEREENERLLKEAREREENERRLKEAQEKEENERRMKEAREKEESERREAQEREENERRLREAREREENERRLKEVREKEEHERRQKEAHEREENERREKEAHEREENERREKEAHEREENLRKQKEQQEMEEKERRLEEAHEREENARRLKEDSEREQIETYERKLTENVGDNEGRLKEVRKQEKAFVGLAIHDQQGAENRHTTESCEEVAEIFSQKDASGRMETENRVRNSEEWNEPDTAPHACSGEEQSLKAGKIIEVSQCEEIAKAVNDAGMLDEAKNSNATCGGHEQEGIDTAVKLDPESCTGEEHGRMKTAQNGFELRESTHNCKEAEVSNEQDKDERLTAAWITQCSSEHEASVYNQIASSKTKVDDNENGFGKFENAVRQEKDEQCMKEHLVGLDCVDINKNIKGCQKLGQADRDGIKTEVELINEEEKRTRPKFSAEFNINQDKKERNQIGFVAREVSGKEGRMAKEREQEKERLRKLEEDIQREREREKDRMAVERMSREACERAFAETRERAERAAVERATAEARQRAMAEAREKLEKACAEAREKSLAEKANTEARLRAERAAVERATAEARERAEKAMVERAAMEARGRTERSVSEKYSAASRDRGLRQSTSFSSVRDAQFQGSSSFSSSQRYSNSSNHSDKNQGIEVESAQRCKARLERNQRTVERAAKALEEKNLRDYLAQREQAERNRLSETLDADVKRWSSGKEGNLRALLSTLQYILGTESGWHPIPLTDVVTAVAVKKAYRKATLCVHPDKLQQRGASIQQKYVCEKVFDLLKDAWNKFNSEER